MPRKNPYASNLLVNIVLTKLVIVLIRKKKVFPLVLYKSFSYSKLYFYR